MIVKFNPQSNYTAIPNAILHDYNLSAQAMALVCYLNSLPNNWQPKTESLCAKLKMSSKTLWKYLKELEAKGILQIVNFRSKQGHITGIKAFILQDPKAKNDAPNSPNHRAIISTWSECPNLGNCKDDTPQEYGVSSTRQNLPRIKNKESKNKHGNLCAHARELSREEEESHPTNPSLWSKGLQTLKRLFTQQSTLNLDCLEQSERVAFEDFLAYRQEHTKITHSTKRVLLNHCLELKNQGHDIAACIYHSMRNNYRDIFPPKEYTQTKAKGILDHIIKAYNGFSYANMEESLVMMIDHYIEAHNEA
ncbi:helix-turn-helix domain-containing protein [Helicobacter salomonis]|uniref:helix-turn-helix domain-containing protein n=1 Tax=Helicobacter salomonis TaxID=56878 RepID=UPI000CF15E39|nr:helix-turn-helix domain-containing protein [Helicobacter salomonis]